MSDNYKLPKEELRVSGIYAYFDPVYDEIVYIGRSTNIWKRNLDHYGLGNYYRQPINQILLRNRNRYDFILLKKCPASELDYWEKTLIALYNPRYNKKRYQAVIVCTE